ncbi:AlpA family transcriptional regulator [Motilibacter rhizosphaerae]|uniref:AlpA family transcriptional regulator n=1 Tax=Motilibacter rhizosphaerae TaxID=598652 RepID=A0A4Q7NSP6_9ACTN|nr:helix-turn-helix domain-containing protein [Motilibacter rhizosphaerae]RZS89880.1 AlpA family transcriptional regulator [Motilibacter rhizosphaerae]
MREPFVSPAAVGEHIGKPVSWIYNNAERLGIPRYRLGKQLRFRLSEVDAWLAQQSEGTAA